MAKQQGQQQQLPALPKGTIHQAVDDFFQGLAALVGYGVVKEYHRQSTMSQIVDDGRGAYIAASIATSEDVEVDTDAMGKLVKQQVGLAKFKAFLANFKSSSGQGGGQTP